MFKNYKKFCGPLFLFLVIISFFSCSSTKNLSPSLAPVYVTNGKKITLLSPECAAVTIDSVYSLSMSFGKDSFSVIAYAQLDESGISMTMLNDFGTDMGTMQFDGLSVLFDSPLLPENLKAEYVIADIQNIYYDKEKLSENYQKSGLIFEENIIDGKKYRYVKDGKKVIEEISFEGSTVKLVNNLRGYEYILIEAE